jgi:hypothetical protein
MSQSQNSELVKIYVKTLLPSVGLYVLSKLIDRCIRESKWRRNFLKVRAARENSRLI